MTRPRDSQRSKVYAAEEALRTDITEDDALWIADKITHSRWWAKRVNATLAKSPVMFVDFNTCGARTASQVRGGTRTIYLPFKARSSVTQLSVYHALAHLIVTDDNIAWHGPEFCRLELEMVRRFYSSSVESNLRTEFRKRGVKTRTMSEEAKDAARERWYVQKEKTLQSDLERLLKDLGE